MRKVSDNRITLLSNLFEVSMHQQTIYQLALVILAILSFGESAKPAVWEFTSSDVSKLNEGEWLFEV